MLCTYAESWGALRWVGPLACFLVTRRPLLRPLSTLLPRVMRGDGTVGSTPLLPLPRVFLACREELSMGLGFGCSLLSLLEARVGRLLAIPLAAKRATTTQLQLVDVNHTPAQSGQ